MYKNFHVDSSLVTFINIFSGISVLYSLIYMTHNLFFGVIVNTSAFTYSYKYK